MTPSPCASINLSLISQLFFDLIGGVLLDMMMLNL